MLLLRHFLKCVCALGFLCKNFILKHFWIFWNKNWKRKHFHGSQLEFFSVFGCFLSSHVWKNSFFLLVIFFLVASFLEGIFSKIKSVIFCLLACLFFTRKKEKKREKQKTKTETPKEKEKKKIFSDPTGCCC